MRNGDSDAEVPEISIVSLPYSALEEASPFQRSKRTSLLVSAGVNPSFYNQNSTVKPSFCKSHLRLLSRFSEASSILAVPPSDG